MIYLDNAATTMHKPPSVIDAVVKAMQTMGNASRGAARASLTASRVDYAARAAVARLFGCPRSDHVCFACNATEALNTAICGLVRPGDHVVTTELEHNSVLRPLYRLRDEGGVRVDFVPVDFRGTVDYTDFERLVRPDTRVVVCNHASNVTGTLVDIAKVSEIAHRRGALLVLDASQTGGTRDIDMAHMGVDMLCFTGHKGLMGPQGTGGLCLVDDMDVRPLKVGGTGVQSYSETQPEQYPTRLEAGTLNSHGIAGLAAALDYISDIGVGRIGDWERSLMRRFYDGVVGIKGVKIYGDFASDDRAAIVALNISDAGSSEISDELSEHFDIATRPGAHCAPLVHRAIGTANQGAVRFSFGWFNTEDEVDAAIEAVREIAS